MNRLSKKTEGWEPCLTLSIEPGTVVGHIGEIQQRVMLDRVRYIWPCENMALAGFWKSFPKTLTWKSWKAYSWSISTFIRRSNRWTSWKLIRPSWFLSPRWNQSLSHPGVSQGKSTVCVCVCMFIHWHCLPYLLHANAFSILASRIISPRAPICLVPAWLRCCRVLPVACRKKPKFFHVDWRSSPPWSGPHTAFSTHLCPPCTLARLSLLLFNVLSLRLFSCCSLWQESLPPPFFMFKFYSFSRLSSNSTSSLMFFSELSQLELNISPSFEHPQIISVP